MLDEMFDVLSNEHRRRLLAALRDRNPHTEVQIPEGLHVGERTLRNLQLAMSHHHLPRLADAGYIEWQRGPPLPWISVRVGNVGPLDRGTRATSAGARTSDQRAPLYADKPVPQPEEEQRREETEQRDRPDEYNSH